MRIGSCPASPPPMTATVNIPAIRFNPVNVAIQQGGTVTWQNTDTDTNPGYPGGMPVDHSATSDNGLFSTGIFSDGERTVTFNTPGSFPYHCLVHGFLMTGTGIVPPSTFTLQSNDVVRITIDSIGTLENTVM